jgi:hypothetical protein
MFTVQATACIAISLIALPSVVMLMAILLSVFLLCAVAPSDAPFTQPQSLF